MLSYGGREGSREDLERRSRTMIAPRAGTRRSLSRRAPEHDPDNQTTVTVGPVPCRRNPSELSQGPLPVPPTTAPTALAGFSDFARGAYQSGADDHPVSTRLRRLERMLGRADPEAQLDRHLGCSTSHAPRFHKALPQLVPLASRGPPPRTCTRTPARFPDRRQPVRGVVGATSAPAPARVHRTRPGSLRTPPAADRARSTRSHRSSQPRHETPPPGPAPMFA